MTKAFTKYLLRKRKALLKLLLLIFILAPWLEYKERAFLRLDLATFTLHVLGLKFPFESLFLFLLFIAALSSLFMALSMLLGRLWCGWFCPQTLVCDLTEPLKRKPLLFYAAIFLLSLVLTFTFYFYFQSPYAYIFLLFSTKSTSLPLFWLLLFALLIFLNFAFYRRGFCRELCLTAWIQKMGFDEYTLRVDFLRERRSECQDCKACIKVCPLSLDLRDNFDNNCIACAQCLVICEKIMAIRGKDSLFSFTWGKMKNFTSRLFYRPNVLFTFAVSMALFLIIPLYYRFQSDLRVGSYVRVTKPNMEGKGVKRQLVIVIENRSDKKRILAVKSIPSQVLSEKEIEILPKSKRTYFLDLPELPKKEEPIKIILLETLEGKILFEKKITP